MRKILLTIIFLFLISCSKGVYLKSILPNLKWDNNLKNQKIVIDKEFQERAMSGMKINFIGELKENQLIAEVVTDVDAERAAKIFYNKTTMIRGLYSIQETPFGGNTTKEAGCFEDLEINPAPLENKIQASLLFNLKATERLILGVCLEEQTIFRTQALMLYCKNRKTFYDLRYYYPKAQKTILLPIASCLD